MSIYAKQWAYKQVAGSPGKKAVLVALAEFADGNGEVTAGQQRISTMTELDVRTIRRHMKALEDDGFIRREHRQREDGARTSDKCTLIAPIEELNPPEPPDKTTGRSPGQNDRKGQSNRTKNAGQPDTVSGVINGIEPSGEPSGERARETSPVTKRCVQLLSSIKGHKKTEVELTDLVEELSKKYPGADAEQACSDLEFNIRHGSDKMERLAGKLKTYFRKDSEKRPAPSANGKKLHAEGEVWTENGKTFKKVGGEKIEVLN